VTSRPAPVRRGLRRIDAALYVGVSVTKFDEMCADGRMPMGFAIDSMRVWDVRDLDEAFERLKEPVKEWAKL
jgi:hypothetical protein